jgi:putative helicase MOV10L1
VELENRKNWLETRPSESKKENVCPHESDLTVEQQSIVGTITKMSRHGGGIINGDAAVFSQDAVVKGYVPCVGDWVRADVQCCISAVINIDEDQWTATKVQPLRVKTVEGRIRALFGGYGFIDEDIYFCFKVCCSPYQPRKGDMVKVTVIECSYKQTHWRAIRLEPSRGRVVNPRSGCRRPHTAVAVQSGDDDDIKNGVFVTRSLDAGQIFVGQTTSIIAFVRNENINKVITFNSCKSVQGGCTVSVYAPCNNQSENDGTEGLQTDDKNCRPVMQLPLELQSGHQCAIELTIFGKDLGFTEHKLHFDFLEFVIVRVVSVSVYDPLQSAVAPSTPYKRSTHFHRYRHGHDSEFSDSHSWQVPGRRPIRPRTVYFPNKLQQYSVPTNIRACIVERRNILDVCPSIGKPLTIDSYRQRFASLLYIEEVEMDINIRQFDMMEANMDTRGPFLVLTVPGLAEGRPSLLMGDKVIVSVPGARPEEPCYEGYIHEIHEKDLLLKFSEDFHKKFRHEDYDIQFTFNRTPLRRCHQAVEFAKSINNHVLFPGKIIPKPAVASVQLKGGSRTGKSTRCGFFNCSLNGRQREAVQRMVAGQCRPAPYILFGPPGTGKTVTLVEGILQVLHRMPSSRILACAPSNSAADLISERLHMSGAIQQGDMARLNAYQREKPPPDCIEAYCHTADDLAVVSRYRIVVSTCVTAGILYSLGLNAGHFTHVFVDEAGQATEPECLIALNFVTGLDGQVILTGDPFQLGAVIQSAIARTHGLDVSLLERLINRPCYQRDEHHYADCGNYNPFCVTKLVDNYRSHPALLSLPSETFYHGELVCCADQQITHMLCSWDHLPNKNNFPVLFHGVRGEDIREANSPSWFNPVEAVQVVKYVQALLTGSLAVEVQHIGIIAPYRKQVEKIRLLLDSFGVNGIKIGSVEEFQGQERRVIILSTVRSTASLIAFDVQHCMGFLSNPKRFNVAITRAQALLLVVGDPFVLSTDDMWRSLIRYCKDHNGYVGCDIGQLDIDDSSNKVQKSAGDSTDSTDTT